MKVKKPVRVEESKDFAGIAERKRTAADQFFGIVEGGTPCFVYREKNRRSGSKRSFIFSIIIIIIFIVSLKLFVN